MLSLRGQWVGNAAVLGTLVLGAAVALTFITSQMERGSSRLWQASESVRAAEELEVTLLLHSRERRLLELTRVEAHARELKSLEARLQQWLGQARQHLGSSEEQELLAELEAEIADYLARVHGGPEAQVTSAASIERSLTFAERLVDLNVTDARHALEAVQRWNRAADVIGIVTGLVLLAGVAVVLWGFQRQVYRPLQDISHALASYRPGAAAPAPESGSEELRGIVRRFNEMVGRLERQREVQLAFLAAVAHDLRNPLQALRLSVAASRREPAPRTMDVVRRQVDRLERMVEDLLDTARVEAGQLELRLDEHDLVDLVRESVELHRPVSSQHVIDTELPGGPLPLACDATRVTQVLNNLLSNALKYSPEGGTVRVRLSREDGGASLSVTDPGIGIPEGELQSIFEPFRRSSKTRGGIPGVGLGLSVSRRIIEAHGGRLEVSSREGQGATFRVWLPGVEVGTTPPSGAVPVR